jgi:hypothetical protein
MQTGAGDVAFLASRAGATADCPCFVITIKKNGSLKVYNYVIKIVHIFIALLNVTMQKYTVFV